jgi:F0F1-type ATP synthase membrane subunit c/vacuolar-type H+-ATPase subunit K
MKEKLLIFLLLVTSYFLLVTPLLAQSFDVTYTYDNIDSTAKDGDILFSSDQRLSPANSPYSNKIFGVLEQSAVIVYRDVSNQKKPVARNGIAAVNVTSANGAIKKGDFITSSSIAGKGQKADQSGYVLGIALEDFSGQGAQALPNSQLKTGKINVALRIEYAEINSARSVNQLVQYINQAIFKDLQDPTAFAQIIRYLAAGLTVMIAFVISFLTFSRAITKGVEGIGRNPLAKNAIQFSIIVNAALTTVIALVGVIASFIILRL